MKRITYWPQLVLGLAFNWGALLGWSAVAVSCQWATVLPLYAGSICWTLVYDTIYAHQVSEMRIGIGRSQTTKAEKSIWSQKERWSKVFSLLISLLFSTNSYSLISSKIWMLLTKQDKTDDISAGVKSTALLFNNSTIPILSIFSTLFLSNLLYSVSTISPLLPTLTTISTSSVSSLLGPLLTTGHPMFLTSMVLASIHLFRQLKNTNLDERASCWKGFCSNRDLGAIVWMGLASDYFIQVGLKGVLDGMVVVG